ncbi:MAG TPA: hypothetical protein VGB79_09090 [Allosphingosinicella sp.]|jgi:hypothetical protein
MPTGYSGRPLGAKLGLKEGQRAWRSGMPASVAAEIEVEVPGLAFLAEPAPGLDVAHIFTTSRIALEAELARLRPLLAPAGMIWVSWPKKASKVPTDITEDIVREVAFPHGLVDVKVCAVDATWSGLKLVVRKALRT